MSSPRIPLFFAAASLAFAAFSIPVRATAESVFVDPFDDGDVRAADAQPYFWSVVQSEGNRDSEAAEENGRLRLRAADQAHTFLGLVSPTLETFGFFQRPVTVTLDDIALEARGIPDGEARFKISLVSSQSRAEVADDAISLRVRPGLILLGYRIDGFNTPTSPENLSGDRVNSVVFHEIAGTPSRLSLTLGPGQRVGTVRYEIRAEGEGVSFNRSGTLALTLAQWGGLDAASLVVDARRDSPVAERGTHTEFSVGQITVTR